MYAVALSSKSCPYFLCSKCMCSSECVYIHVYKHYSENKFCYVGCRNCFKHLHFFSVIQRNLCHNMSFLIQRIRPRKATIEELQSCHTDLYAEIFGGNPYNRQRLMGKNILRIFLMLIFLHLLVGYSHYARFDHYTIAVVVRIIQ